MPDLTENAPTRIDAGLDRRQLLTRAGAVGLGVAAAGVLAACGGGGGGAAGGGGGGGAAQATTGSDGSLAKVSDIPVGSAVAAQDSSGRPILISQPQSGQIVAMTAICTHMGCTVAPGSGQLVCPCHCSVYSLTGDNVSGPAPKPLAHVDVHVSNGEVFAGKA
jgi:nitrite reductase/ring-hydroxylating ferredoxin subunit